MSTALYVLTPQGARTALRLAPFVEGRIHAVESLRDCDVLHGLAHSVSTPPVQWFSNLAELVRGTFSVYPRHIFLTAAGIAVRAIAPLLQSKLTDPAVLVADHNGAFVVSLLSGHAGGANAFTLRVAEILGATPVITTATDLESLPAVDALALERGLAIANPGAIKRISGELVAGRPVELYDEQNRLGLRGSRWEGLFLHRSGLPPDSDTDEQENSGASLSEAASAAVHGGVPCILVTHKTVYNPRGHRCLVLHPPVLFAGVGCKRGTTAESILETLHRVLHAHGLASASLVCLASVDAKRQEPGLNAAAAKLGLPVRFFPPAVLKTLPVTSPSPKAAAVFGIQGVCEPAALAVAGENARLLAPKTTGDGCTVAIAGRF